VIGAEPQIGCRTRKTALVPNAPPADESSTKPPACQDARRSVGPRYGGEATGEREDASTTRATSTREAHVELPEDVVQVGLDGLRAEEQHLGARMVIRRRRGP
jgi:hypothetical protein